jgi:hypothetical protein
MKHKPEYIYLLKCFWDHQRHYYVLIKTLKGWHWVNLEDGTYFSRNHRTKEQAMIGAKDQGTIQKIELIKLFPQGT